MLARERVLGLALLLVGGALLAYALASEPPPEGLSTAFRRADEAGAAPERLLAHGPALGARYDAVNGTTLAVFDCMAAHIRCDAALELAGDQRAALEGDGLMLRPRAGASLARTPLAEPLPVLYGEAVDARFAGVWEVAPRWPGAAARLAGVALLVAGAALVAAARSLALGAAGSGAFVAAALAANEGTYVILLQLVLVLVTLAGLFTLVLGWRRPRARAAGLALLGFAPVLVGVFASGALAFFPFDGV